MNIIICGAGRVGFTIAKLLSEQGHSITVIDQSSEDIQKINDSLDVKAIVGKATYPSILEKANASETDMIIAVTRNDEINMLICQIAFSIFKIGKKIALIPIAFVSEHSETLVELDIEYKELADKNGCVEYVRVPALGVNVNFISSLSNLVINKADNKLTEHLYPPKIQCPNNFKKCPCLNYE